MGSGWPRRVLTRPGPPRRRHKQPPALFRANEVSRRAAESHFPRTESAGSSVRGRSDRVAGSAGGIKRRVGARHVLLPLGARLTFSSPESTGGAGERAVRADLTPPAGFALPVAPGPEPGTCPRVLLLPTRLRLPPSSHPPCPPAPKPSAPRGALAAGGDLSHPRTRIEARCWGPWLITPCVHGSQHGGLLGCGRHPSKVTEFLSLPSLPRLLPAQAP